MGGLKIQNKINKDAGYITGGFFSAFLPGGDILQIFIAIIAILALALGFFAFYKKKKSSEKVNRRISSLRREFNNVKEESSNKNEYDWIKMRLDGDDPDLDDMIITNDE